MKSIKILDLVCSDIQTLDQINTDEAKQIIGGLVYCDAGTVEVCYPEIVAPEIIPAEKPWYPRDLKP